MRSTATRDRSTRFTLAARLSASYVALSSCAVMQYVPLPSVRIFVHWRARSPISVPENHVLPDDVSHWITVGGRFAGA